jgi:hypothetical protein
VESPDLTPGRPAKIQRAENRSLAWQVRFSFSKNTSKTPAMPLAQNCLARPLHLGNGATREPAQSLFTVSHEIARSFAYALQDCCFVSCTPSLSIYGITRSGEYRLALSNESRYGLKGVEGRQEGQRKAVGRLDFVSPEASREALSVYS